MYATKEIGNMDKTVTIAKPPKWLYLIHINHKVTVPTPIEQPISSHSDSRPANQQKGQHVTSRDSN